MFPATYLPRLLIPRIARTDPSPPWQWPFALAYTGVRGIVSLAAALAIPLATDNGDPFPDRDLILFLTFSVILVTLVGQGLLLPTVIRALGLHNAGWRERGVDKREELAARRQAVGAAIERLNQLATERELPEHVVQTLRAQYQGRLKHFEHTSDPGDGHQLPPELRDEIELLLITSERDRVIGLHRRGTLQDEARRRIERELDLREATLANHQHKE
jgi:CPA1 family monovalent cation:H+ antiporter